MIKRNPQAYTHTPVFHGKYVNQPWYKELRAQRGDMINRIPQLEKQEDLMMFWELVAFSPLKFVFRQRVNQRGWAQGIIMGDTRTNKSMTIDAMNRYHGVGPVRSMGVASRAGLLFGAEQATDGTWITKWGLFPSHDGGMVALDEITHADVFKEFTSVRSEGIAENNKMGGGVLKARVRQIYISNPAPGRNNAGTLPLMDHPYGAVSAINSMFEPQDVARFDIAMPMIMRGDVVEIMNQIEIADLPPPATRYTSEFATELLRWAWSVKHNDIVFTMGAHKALAETATYFVHKFESPGFRTIGDIETKTKLARLGAALAIRAQLFDQTKTRVIVHSSVIYYLADWLDKIYSSPEMGLLEFVEDDRIRRQGSEDDIERFIPLFNKHGGATLLDSIAKAGDMISPDTIKGALVALGSSLDSRDLHSVAVGILHALNSCGMTSGGKKNPAFDYVLRAWSAATPSSSGCVLLVPKAPMISQPKFYSEDDPF